MAQADVTRLIAVLVCLWASQAGAQANCAAHSVVVGRLADQYGEVRQSIGLAPGNRVIETFANIETGTWTITLTGADGRACLFASGQAFKIEPQGEPI